MDRHSGGILRRFLSAALLAAAFAAALPCRSFAADKEEPEIYSDNPLQRAIAYGIQVGLMIADEIPVAEWKKTMEGMDETANERAVFKHGAYANDHFMLSGGNVVTADATAYINNLKSPAPGAPARFPGYRAMTPADAHSKVYRERVESWTGRMKGMMAKNRDAVNDILAAYSRGDVEKLYNVSSGVYGYTRQMEAGALAANYLNTELTKL
ncbi:MAG: hypothetical protein LBU26_05135, partial [Synergistaceae bacterium]|nr:hypothetical protein [Synergistaceae bacterium]